MGPSPDLTQTGFRTSSKSVQGSTVKRFAVKRIGARDDTSQRYEETATVQRGLCSGSQFPAGARQAKHPSQASHR